MLSILYVSTLAVIGHSHSVSCLGESNSCGIDDEASLLQLSAVDAHPGHLASLLRSASEERHWRAPDTREVHVASLGKSLRRFLEAYLVAHLSHRNGNASAHDAAWLQHASSSASGANSTAGRVEQSLRGGDQVIIVVVLVFVLLGVAISMVAYWSISVRPARENARKLKRDPAFAYRADYQGNRHGYGEPMPSSQESLRPLGTSDFGSTLPRNDVMERERMMAEKAGPSTPMSNTLCPDFPGAIVPKDCKFVVKMPSLLEAAQASTHMVMTNNNENMFEIRLGRCQSTIESVPVEEDFKVSIPDGSHKELASCALSRSEACGLQCEVFKRDSRGRDMLFGILAEDNGQVFEAKNGFAAYTLTLTSGKRLVTIAVKGSVQDRQVKIVNGDGSPTSEVASVISDGARTPKYAVECYPHADVILIVISLAAVDRLAALGGNGG